MRRAGRTQEAVALEAQSAELSNHWKSKLPNGDFLIRQAREQITPNSPVRSSSGY
jgi:hypothetical protein